MKILFLSFTCKDIGVAMVTNMISQLQESFPLRRAAGSFEISFTKWLRGAKTVQLPVTFSMSCQIFTSILFPSLKNIQEDLRKSDLLFRKWKKKAVFYVGISCWKYLSLYFQHTTIKFLSPRSHVRSSIYISFFINDFNHFFI